MKALINIYWIIAALLAALFFRSFIVSIHKIPSDSMSPNFIAGDFIISSQIAYKLQFPWSQTEYYKENPKPGDLVILQFSAKKAADKSMAQYLKRVVAVAGDLVEIQKGRLIINGQPCTYEATDVQIVNSTHQVFNETCQGRQNQVVFDMSKEAKELQSFPEQKIAENELYVLSDNRSILDDSRDLGTVTNDQIASKVSLILMSYGSTQDFISGSNQVRWNRILTKPR